MSPGRAVPLDSVPLAPQVSQKIEELLGGICRGETSPVGALEGRDPVGELPIVLRIERLVGTTPLVRDHFCRLAISIQARADVLNIGFAVTTPRRCCLRPDNSRRRRPSALFTRVRSHPLLGVLANAQWRQ